MQRDPEQYRCVREIIGTKRQYSRVCWYKQRLIASGERHEPSGGHRSATRFWEGSDLESHCGKRVYYAGSSKTQAMFMDSLLMMPWTDERNLT